MNALDGPRVRVLGVERDQRHPAVDRRAGQVGPDRAPGGDGHAGGQLHLRLVVEVGQHDRRSGEVRVGDPMTDGGQGVLGRRPAGARPRTPSGRGWRSARSRTRTSSGGLASVVMLCSQSSSECVGLRSRPGTAPGRGEPRVSSGLYSGTSRRRCSQHLVGDGCARRRRTGRAAGPEAGGGLRRTRPGIRGCSVGTTSSPAPNSSSCELLAGPQPGELDARVADVQHQAKL